MFILFCRGVVSRFGLLIVLIDAWQDTPHLLGSDLEDCGILRYVHLGLEGWREFEVYEVSVWVHV